MPPAPSGSAPQQPAKRGGSAFTGRTIARCKVGEKLGRGATSHVFRAFHEGLGKDIALKILSTEAADSEEMRKRFLSEARAIAKLSHENIVKVYDTVEDQGMLCILMELVPGGTLQDRLDDVDVLEPRIAFRIAAQIARALEAAHEMKLVHRDIKPANVMLVGKAGEENVKVVDFGLAVQADMNRVGTPMFMSPEAAQGKRIDEKSDVYALGVCLYRMLTGVLPFTGDSVKEILAAQVNMEAVLPSQRRLVLGTQYDEIVKKLLVKSKGYRPTAGEAADLLEDIADDLDERDEGIKRIRRRKKRVKPEKPKKSNPMIWVGLVFGGILIVLIFWVAGRAPRAQPGGGGTDDPGTRPPPAAVDPAQKAYEEADRWIASNAVNYVEAAKRWAHVEQTYPGTVWATRAGVSRVAALAAQAEADKKKADAAEIQRIKDEQRAAENDPRVKARRIDVLVKALDFRGAFDLMESIHDVPAGTDKDEWDRRMSRLELLAKQFMNKVGPGIDNAKPKLKAKDLFPKAKDGETVKGAYSDGATILTGPQDEHRAPWSEADPASFFKRKFLNLLDQADPDTNLMLAALAKELGQPEKTVANFREEARTGLEKSMDPEDVARKLELLFGK